MPGELRLDLRGRVASAPVGEELRAPQLVIFAPGDRDFMAERGAFPATPIADAAPGIDMLYSSGTTGRPKGIRPALPEGDLDQTNALTEFGRERFGMGPARSFSRRRRSIIRRRCAGA
jgi:long-chain acyl-CoA synthetase